jgi:uncharacterized protein YdeI (YjbR/CyaY-like superfamily)
VSPTGKTEGKKLLRVARRADWRAWLERNHATAREVWLVYAKAHTGRPRVSYDEAVEEALCFGWIDGIARRLDEDYYAQRFTPRSNTLNWSKKNLERFDRLAAQRRMTAAGRVKRPADVTAPPRRHQSGDPIPSFVRKGLAAHPLARRNFLALAPGYRRDYIRWITEAKKPETRARRLEQAVRRLEANRKRAVDVTREERRGSRGSSRRTS